jgi:cytosine/adenosine deaminase-related metal-dependent hydrolase
MEADMFPAETVFELMTVNGRKSIGFSTKVGEIKPGFKADLTIIEYPAPHISMNDGYYPI